MNIGTYLDLKKSPVVVPQGFTKLIVSPYYNKSSRTETTGMTFGERK